MGREDDGLNRKGWCAVGECWPTETWEVTTAEQVFHAWDAGYDAVHVFFP